MVVVVVVVVVVVRGSTTTDHRPTTNYRHQRPPPTTDHHQRTSLASWRSSRRPSQIGGRSLTDLGKGLGSKLRRLAESGRQWETVGDSGGLLLGIFRASTYEQETLTAIESNRKSQQYTPTTNLGRAVVVDASLASWIHGLGAEDLLRVADLEDRQPHRLLALHGMRGVG